MDYWIENSTNKVIKSVKDMPADVVGFIYLLVTPEGSYIGKKSLYTKRKKKFTKKQIALIKDKRKKHWEYVIKESDWKTYCSSQKELKKKIKEGLKCEKYILDYAYSKRELSYKEEKQLFINEVLESNKWFNSNISGRYFKNILEKKKK